MLRTLACWKRACRPPALNVRERRRVVELDLPSPAAHPARGPLEHELPLHGSRDELLRAAEQHGGLRDVGDADLTPLHFEAAAAVDCLIREAREHLRDLGDGLLHRVVELLEDDDERVPTRGCFLAPCKEALRAPERLDRVVGLDRNQQLGGERDEDLGRGERRPLARLRLSVGEREVEWEQHEALLLDRVPDGPVELQPVLPVDVGEHCLVGGAHSEPPLPRQVVRVELRASYCVLLHCHTFKR